MDIMTETSKRIEKLEKANAWLDNELRTANTKLGKCKKLLRMAVNDLEKQMYNLCEMVTVEDMNSPYSPCSICANEELCRRNAVGIVKWIHADEVREVLEDES